MVIFPVMSNEPLSMMRPIYCMYYCIQCIASLYLSRYLQAHESYNSIITLSYIPRLTSPAMVLLPYHISPDSWVLLYYFYLIRYLQVDESCYSIITLSDISKLMSPTMVLLLYLIRYLRTHESNYGIITLSDISRLMSPTMVLLPIRYLLAHESYYIIITLSDISRLMSPTIVLLCYLIRYLQAHESFLGSVQKPLRAFYNMQSAVRTNKFFLGK